MPDFEAMRFPPEHYLEAARERIGDAAALHAQGRYVAATYLSGVAVECMVRAYKGRQDSEFEGRHDIRTLMKSSGILEFIREDEQKAFAAHIGTICQFWQNNLRYAETSRFESWINPKGRAPMTAVRVSTLVYESATYVVTRGERRWNSKPS